MKHGVQHGIKHATLGLLIVIGTSFASAQESGGAASGGEMSGGASGPAALAVSQTGDLGEFLVDAEGMTLYMFTNDTENTSNCYDDCAEAWPPVLSEGDPTLGEGLDAALVSTTERTDGTTQVTYGGMPLYYWVKDAAPGDTTGQNVGEVWFVVSPAGEIVQ